MSKKTDIEFGSGLVFTVIEGDGLGNNPVMIEDVNGVPHSTPSWISWPLKLTKTKDGLSKGILVWDKDLDDHRLWRTIHLFCQMRKGPHGNLLMMIGSDHLGWINLWPDWNIIIGLTITDDYPKLLKAYQLPD